MTPTTDKEMTNTTGRKISWVILFLSIMVLLLVVFPGYKICGSETKVSLSRMEKRTTNYFLGFGLDSDASPWLAQSPKASNTDDWETLFCDTRLGLPREYSSNKLQTVQADFSTLVYMEKLGEITPEQKQKFIDFVSAKQIDKAIVYCHLLTKKHPITLKEERL